MVTKNGLIEKLYRGTCSRQELEQLLDFLIKDSAIRDADVMARLWEELRSYPKLEEQQASIMMRKMLQRVEEKEITTKQHHVGTKKERKFVPFSQRHFVRMAIAAVGLVLLGVLSWLWLSREKMMIVQTVFAEQKTIELPDQSRVKLNANSTLKFDKNWSVTKARRVWLEGEAYFEVKKIHGTSQKFQVITGDLTVEVLGTIFNVNAREKATEVFLEEGSVSLDLQEQADGILMEPGDLVTYSRSFGKPRKKRIVNEAPASWKDGTAVMESATLEEIIQKLHEVYDINIEVENQADLKREFSIRIPVDNPETGYQLLIELTGLNIEKAEKQWTIK